MVSATDYREWAAACRRAAELSGRPNTYLRELAEHYDQRAAHLDGSFSGQKPGPLQAHDLRQQKPRR
jgi:hypothetical protein